MASVEDVSNSYGGRDDAATQSTLLSLGTLQLSATYIEQFRDKDENMNRSILENTVLQYDLLSLEDAETAAGGKVT